MVSQVFNAAAPFGSKGSAISSQVADLQESATVTRDRLALRYAAIRGFTEKLCEPLETEDYVIQSMPDVSPTRWHLAHTTWFFENFALARFLPNFAPLHPGYQFLFNSYYNSVSRQFPRPRRGVLSRPTVSEVFDYRRDIDQRLLDLLAECDSASWPALAAVVELGLHHEQQHQELLLTDIKHVFSCNPLYPVYRANRVRRLGRVPRLEWLEYEEQVASIGHRGGRFAYDNEGPRHRTLIPPRQLASRPVTNGEYLQFIEDGGYRRAELWLSAGWSTVEEQGGRAPLYWIRQGDGWSQFTLNGFCPLEGDEPLCHVSYFEADAFARWAGARLPTEAEWEVAAGEVPLEGNFVEDEAFRPTAEHAAGSGLRQMFGDVWEWTSSPYTAYPGYMPAAGALGEYNGKFMCNQYVLRGGSCGTSRSHIRPTYRNFFPPEARWQFTGFRLAR